MAKVKTYELRTKSKADLMRQLEDLKTELSQLRVDKVNSGTPAKLTKIKEVRKSIARVSTVISQTQRQQVALLYANKKYKPLDLRAKKTRAIRRQLTKYEKSRKSQKEIKKQTHFAPRKYAIKA
ncbi:hypothetical protein NDN08_000443 [Rhodosorus marinus]|uniref:60S ribosomal protein L35 n=1 Tax=Rhodosorus marinus TaxID=101924 RepID=A0AAV8US04_9RHOD|nr:hypothetical protein NDN08_000443 [Rhodosorus marinus]